MISSVSSSHNTLQRDASGTIAGKGKEKPKSLKDLLARHNQAAGNVEENLDDVGPPSTEEMKDMLQEAFLDVKDAKRRSSHIDPNAESSTNLLRDLDDFTSAFNTDDVSVAFSEVEWKDRGSRPSARADGQKKSSKSKDTEQADVGPPKAKSGSKDALDKKRKTLKKKVTAEDLGLTEDEFKDPARLQEALKRWAKDHGKADENGQHMDNARQSKQVGRLRVSSRSALPAEDAMTVRRRSKSRGRPLVLPDQPKDGDQNRNGSSQSVVSEVRRRTQSRGRHTTSIRSKSRGRLAAAQDDDEKSVVSRAARSKSRARGAERKTDLSKGNKEPTSRAVGRNNSFDSTGSESRVVRRTSSVRSTSKINPPVMASATGHSSDDESEDSATDEEEDDAPESPESAAAPSRGRSAGRQAYCAAPLSRVKSVGRLKAPGGTATGNSRSKSLHRSYSRPKVKAPEVEAPLEKSDVAEAKLRGNLQEELPSESFHSQSEEMTEKGAREFGAESGGHKADSSDDQEMASPRSKKKSISSRISALKSAFLGGNRGDADGAQSSPIQNKSDRPSLPSSGMQVMPQQDAGEDTIEKISSRRPSTLSRNKSTEWSEIDFTALQNGVLPEAAAVVRTGNLLGNEDDDGDSESTSSETDRVHRDSVKRTSSLESLPRKVERKTSNAREDYGAIREGLKSVGASRKVSKGSSRN
jgi:hypothetical protein